MELTQDQRKYLRTQHLGRLATVRPDGTPQNNPVGFRVDEEGNLWASAGDGVHCVSPSGDLLGKIKVPFTVANLAFGGRNRAQMFICASHTLYSIYTNVRGVQRP